MSSPVIDVLGDAPERCAELAEMVTDIVMPTGVAPTGLELLLLRLEPGRADAFDRWVVDGAVALLEQLRETLAERPPYPAKASAAASGQPPKRLVVGVWSSEPRDLFEAAAVAATEEMARGVVHSLMREYAGRNVALNTVLFSDATRARLPPTLRYLASADGSYLAGATLNLRELS